MLAVQQQERERVQYRVVTAVSQAGERSRIQASSVLSGLPAERAASNRAWSKATSAAGARDTKGHHDGTGCRGERFHASKKHVAGKMTVPKRQLSPARREPLHGL
jgi:hypothetical protein